MSDLKYKGKTRAQWIATRSQDRAFLWLFAVPQVDIEEALLWFDEQDKKSRHDTEERRFQTQLDETMRHGLWTRWIAGLALLASAVSVGVAILALLKQPPQSSPPAPATLSPVPAASVPQTTNFAPAIQATGTPHKQ